MKKKKAIALGYEGNDAPSVLASAKGVLAEKLLEIARSHDVPIYEDANLAEALSGLNAGDEIPESLFLAVAEVFAHCYRINERLKLRLDELFQ